MATSRLKTDLPADLPSALLIVILIAGVALRAAYSGVNSYWLDELYSVYVYGVAHDSVFEAIGALTVSIHPPLYQFLLYIWMAVFGDGEIATRTLSNLSIAGATLCLFLSVRKVYGTRNGTGGGGARDDGARFQGGAWLGVIVALVFTAMYTPTYYGMETRSYALSIFWSSLSTLLLIYALPAIADLSWRKMAANRFVLALLAVNAAFILTHYYNVLFLAAQGLFLLVALLLRGRPFKQAAVKAFGVGAFPILVLLIVWGPVMVHSYTRRSTSFVVDGLPRAPWETLQDLARWNFPGSVALHLVLAGLALILAVSTVWRLKKHADEETVFTVWFLLAAFAPVLLAFLLFLVSGHERYSSRYFAFSVGPLAVVLVLGLYQLAALLRRIVSLPNWIGLAAVTALAVGLVYPGGINALEKTKRDWRGVAGSIVERISEEPDKRFVIYETTFRPFRTLDYYLGRYGSGIRVHDLLMRNHDGRMETFPVPHADYAIVAFIHHTPEKFPKTLVAMKEAMHLSETRLNAENRGYLVFKISPERDGGD